MAIEEIKKRLEERFENLAASVYEIQSPKTRVYNCFAWAMGESHRPWYPPQSGDGQHWPQVDPQSDEEYWPPRVYAAPLISLFEKAFATKGYARCCGAEHEPGVEKVAIYGYDSQEARHAARQLPNGRWTSKIGGSVDLEHEKLDALEGTFYGRKALVMARPAADPPDPPSFPKLVLPPNLAKPPDPE